MAETYLITAKTVEEAVSVAKREYEDSRHEVSYEIVEMPKKGFLGLGAKPAKIKVTVSKVMTVQSELGSLVADIKSLKNLTDREGRDGHEAKKPQTPAQAPAEAEGQKKPQNQNQKPQNQKQTQKGQSQNGQQSRKQNQSGAQQNEGRQTAPQNGSQQNGSQTGGQQKQGQQPQKQQNGQQSQKQNRNQNQQNQNGQKQSQPVKEQQKKQAEAEKKPAPAQEKAPVQEKPAQEKAPVQESAPVAEVPAEAEKTPAFGESTGYRSALGNQAKPQRRNRQRKSTKSAEEAAVEATGVTVSAPVGLTDFVSEPAENGFGVASQETPAGSGRMNNDVRRKNRQQKEAQKPAVPTVAAPTVIATAAEAAEISSSSSEAAPSRSRRGRRPSNIQKAVNEDMASRYDIAETDEDYEKLDRLTAEADIIEMGSGRAAREYNGEESAEPTAQTPPPAEDRRREAITREEMDYALEFANTLLRNMQLDARAVAAECPEGEEFVVTETADVYPKIDIIGSETGILIGHHGETLDSIQYLVNLSALRKTKSRDGDYVKIVVDIENYREKREETLRSLARRMAARAVRYKRNVFLEPMNAYERRIIHSELQSFENVSTHSVGADRDRKIIITYEGPGRVPDKDTDAAAQTQGQSRRKRRGEDAAEKPAQEKSEGRRKQRAADEETAEKPAQRDRRPRKPAKMPIEQLTDWLPDAGTPETEEASGEEDVLHVMSGLRETFREAVEEIDEVMDELTEQEEAVAEAAEEVEEAVSEELPAEEPVEEPAEEPSEEPVEEPAIAEEPAEESAEEPAEESVEVPEPEEIPAEEPSAEPEEIPAEIPVDIPEESPVEEAAEAVAETVEEAVAEAAETAADSFEEKAQALTDIIESIGDAAADEPENTEAE